VHLPPLLHLLVHIEGAAQLPREQGLAPLRVIWQSSPVQVVLQLPTFAQVTLQPPPAHDNWQAAGIAAW